MLHPFITDRQSALDALCLIDSHGNAAIDEADARARRSRDRGNVVMFCRWRQIERLLVIMQPTGRKTVH